MSTNKTDSFTGAANGSAVTMSKGEFAFSYGVGTDPVGTLVAEISFDGGTTWLALKIPGTSTSASLTAAGVIILFCPREGAQVRTRCSAYTSGTIVGGIHQ